MVNELERDPSDVLSQEVGCGLDNVNVEFSWKRSGHGYCRFGFSDIASMKHPSALRVVRADRIRSQHSKSSFQNGDRMSGHDDHARRTACRSEWGDHRGCRH